jgi:hypothetical protein
MKFDETIPDFLKVKPPKKGKKPAKMRRGGQ